MQDAAAVSCSDTATVRRDSFITRKSLSVQLRVYDIGLCICLGLRYFHNH